jgi:toxin ParE1/3/4
VTAKLVFPTPAAERDIGDAAIYYRNTAGDVVAGRFLREVQDRFGVIGRRPDLGSLRYADALNLPGLRYLRMVKFPYLIFYVEQDVRISVWRLLHGSRDIPTGLQDAKSR